MRTVHIIGGAMTFGLTLAVVSLPLNMDLATGAIGVNMAMAGPGGGGPGGDGGPGAAGGPGGPGAPGAAGVGAAASGNATAAAATDPTTTGLSKAESVLGTTPADDNAVDAVSENQDNSITGFANQMGKDAVAATETIGQLFSGLFSDTDDD